MTNSAAMGYAINAAKAIGLNEQQIKYLVATMNYEMDLYTEEEAEDFYNEYRP